MIFDTHAHYDDEAFDDDREELILSLKGNGIGNVVNVGANLKGSTSSIELADKYDFFYAAVGVHPDDAAEINDEGLAKLRELANNEKVVAIGEIGLDYYWNKENSNVQKEAFERQMELARELSLPIIIHSREAAKDTMDLLTKHNAGQIGGVLHCFSYSEEIALEAIKMGLFIGVGGVVTFKNARKLKDTVYKIPLEKIVLETDCPYLSPEPFRGKRNSSLNLQYVVKTISEIKGIDEETVIKQTFKNAKVLYGRS